MTTTTRSRASGEIARIMAAALSADAMSRKLGFDHGRLGMPWRCPDGCDMLAYSLGHAEGLAEARCGGCGEQAQPELGHG